jgi:hypothetical protein
VPAAVVQVLQNPRPGRLVRSLALLPSALSVLTSWTGTPYSSTFLQLSIPCLTLSLLSPSPPSIPFLSPSLLPHSVLLWNRFKAGFKGWALVWPLVLVLCVVFSISLNGDIFRGLFVFPNVVELEEPVEDGISPYGTRVAIFGTLLLLLFCGVSVSISNMSRINRPSYTLSSSVQAGQGGSSGDWESEFGLDIATQARADWVDGMRWLVGDLGETQEPVQHVEGGRHRIQSDTSGISPPVPLPLNLLLIPIGLVNLVVSVFKVKDGVFQMRHTLSIMIVGIPCWILSLIM